MRTETVTTGLHPKQEKSEILYMVIFSIIISCFTGCSSTYPLKQTKIEYFYGGLRNTQRALPQYVLGFGDEIEVKFFNNEQFNEISTVRPDGRITMQKVGDIYVNGITPSQLDSIITITYANIIIDPEVTVFVRKFGSYQAYVLGEVNTPGGYPVERNMTIVQALAMAGGVKNSAAISSVMVLRQSKRGEIIPLKIDISAYLEGKWLKVYSKDKLLEVAINDFLINPQDIVYVPKTNIASVVAFLDQIYDGLIPPIDTYLRALLWTRYR